MKITFIYTTLGIVASSVSSSAVAALTDEEILASYHRQVDPWAKGPYSHELVKKFVTAEFLTEDFTSKIGQGPELKGLDAMIEDMEKNPIHGISLIHNVHYEFVDPDGVGHVFQDLYFVGWNADKSDMCHYTAPVLNTFTVAEDGRLSSIVSRWNMMSLVECLMSTTTETKEEL
jgi:hypothetical protein